MYKILPSCRTLLSLLEMSCHLIKHNIFFKRRYKWEFLCGMYRYEVFSFVRPFPIIPAEALCRRHSGSEAFIDNMATGPAERGLDVFRFCQWPQLWMIKAKAVAIECYEWRDSGAVGMLSLSWASLHSFRFIMSFFRRKGKEVLRSMVMGWSPDSMSFSRPMLSSWPD